MIYLTYFDPHDPHAFIFLDACFGAERVYGQKFLRGHAVEPRRLFGALGNLAKNSSGWRRTAFVTSSLAPSLSFSQRVAIQL